MDESQSATALAPLKAVFFDAGDTLFRESTEVKDGKVTQSAELIEGAITCLHDLKERGLKVILVADGQTASYPNIFGEHIHLFDAQVISDVVGHYKPHRAMFDAALAAADCDPSEALMVGNRLSRDIVGANALGIRSVWARVCETAYETQSDEDGATPDHVIFRLAELVTLVDALETAAESVKHLTDGGWTLNATISTGTAALSVMRLARLSERTIAKVYDDPDKTLNEATALNHFYPGAPEVLSVDGPLMLLEDLGDDDGRQLSSGELILLCDTLDSGGWLDGAPDLLEDLVFPRHQRLMDEPSLAPWFKDVAAEALFVCSTDLNAQVLCHGDLHRDNIHVSGHGLKVLDPRPANGSRLFDIALYCVTQPDGDRIFGEIIAADVYDEELATAWFDWMIVHRTESYIRYGHAGAQEILQGITQRRWNKPFVVSR